MDQLNFSDVQFEETYTFTLTLTASGTEARPVSVALESVAHHPDAFTYKTSDGTEHTANHGALFACSVKSDLSGELTVPRDNGDLSGEKNVILDNVTWTPSEGALTATVIFTLQYGNWIHADENLLPIPAGSVSIGQLVVRSN